MNTLKKRFPNLIFTREKVLEQIQSIPGLSAEYNSWSEGLQKQFLDYCCGARGYRILYDVYFRAIFNPDVHPEFLISLLEAILDEQICSIITIQNESALVMDDTTLMIFDVVVQLANGTYVNVEVQKVGYLFPGERAACYSSDLLLRQYLRIKKEQPGGSYPDLKPVKTIVIIEHSTPQFHKVSDRYIHSFSQKSDTGLKLELLQEYIFIPLDIFRKCIQNKAMEQRSRLEAWLTFMSIDDPQEIDAFIKAFPDFQQVYSCLYQMTSSIEEAMHMFSEQLRIMDRNTTRLMIEEYAKQIASTQEELSDVLKELKSTKNELSDTEGRLSDVKGELSDVKGELSDVKSELSDARSKLSGTRSELSGTRSKLSDARSELSDVKGELSDVKGELSDVKGELSDAKSELSDARNKLSDRDRTIALLQKELEALKKATL